MAKPNPQEVWRAIDAYLELAYHSTPPSAAVESRVDALRRADDVAFYDSQSIERDSADAPQKLAVRLGNPFYPHMKLVIEPTPDRSGYMFRADTHDKHIRPAPNSREYSLFCELMENNQKLAESIEHAWEEKGLPTFKQYLRNDLARRAASANRDR
jgi:hypothetical protein